MNLPLQSLYENALIQESGIWYQSVKNEFGNRYCVFLCVAKEQDAELLASIYKVDVEESGGDWSALTFVDLLQETLNAGDLLIEPLIDSGKVRALILSAADPASVFKLETLFKL